MFHPLFSTHFPLLDNNVGKDQHERGHDEERSLRHVIPTNAGIQFFDGGTATVQ